LKLFVIYLLFMFEFIAHFVFLDVTEVDNVYDSYLGNVLGGDIVSPQSRKFHAAQTLC